MAEASSHFYAGDIWQIEIQNENLGAVLSTDFDGLAAVAGLGHDFQVGAAGQGVDQHLPDHAMIVGYDNLGRLFFFIHRLVEEARS